MTEQERQDIQKMRELLKLLTHVQQVIPDIKRKVEHVVQALTPTA